MLPSPFPTVSVQYPSTNVLRTLSAGERGASLSGSPFVPGVEVINSAIKEPQGAKSLNLTLAGRSREELPTGNKKVTPGVLIHLSNRPRICPDE